jgi:peroxiredoxin
MTTANMPLQASEHAVPNQATKINPLTVGSTISNGPLQNLDGSETDLATVRKGQKTILVIFRGGWCPYCVRHLEALGQHHQAYVQAGYQVVGISTDGPESLKKGVENSNLPYRVYSDHSFALSHQLGLLFRVDEKTQKKYKTYGIPLRELDGKKTLPVPAVIALDEQGVITFVHADPNFKNRLDPQKLLQSL